MNKRIAVVGLGQMGGRLAKRLIEQGHSIGVYDSNSASVEKFEALGAAAFDSLESLGAAHDVVITVLPNADIVREVVLGEKGLACGMRSGSFLIDMTTSVPSVTVEIAAALAKKGVAMLDAPVSGGVQKAEAGTLTIMVGGPEDVLAVLRPVLEELGSVILHVGDIGAGHIAKALNNLVTAASLAITSEALAVSVAMGVNAKKMLDVINAGSGRSAASETKFAQQVLSRRFAPGFSVALMAKDVGIALDMAQALDTTLVVGSAVRDIWNQAVASGRGDRDHSAIAQLVEDQVGVEICQ